MKSKHSNTVPSVFILESVELNDEKDRLSEGEVLSRILHLSGVKSKYYYIRTKRELLKLLPVFEESNYRYLHIAAHGNSSVMGTTFDYIKLDRLGEILAPYVNNRRVFVSACEMTNTKLAESIFSRSSPYSLMGPAEDILFSDSAIFWASFYGLMFKESSRSMRGEKILEHARELARLFQVKLNYFGRSSKLSRVYYYRRIPAKT